MKLFNQPGSSNTDETLRIALDGARQRGIKRIVVASTTGATIDRLCALKPEGMEIICVSHAAGFHTPGEQELSREKRLQLSEANIPVVTMSHALSGAERCFSNKFGGVSPVEVAAHTLRMFGQGVKVCVEISLMATDAGVIPYGEPVVAVGGSGAGADTALVLRPSHAASFLDTKIDEILCKPRT